MTKDKRWLLIIQNWSVITTTWVSLSINMKPALHNTWWAIHHSPFNYYSFQSFILFVRYWLDTFLCTVICFFWPKSLMWEIYGWDGYDNSRKVKYRRFFMWTYFCFCPIIWLPRFATSGALSLCNKLGTWVIVDRI